MIDFVSFLLSKVYKPKPIPEHIIFAALEKTILDVNYHFNDITKDEIISRIQNNSNELALFLFRIGNELHQEKLESLKPQIHWLLKELCACEIYFNNSIAVGFYIVHGEGTVIGSRNTIGKGFKIHQGCTIGHKKNNFGKGVIIGDNVVLYCNVSVLGDIVLGNNIIIGAHNLISKNIESNKIIILKTEVKDKDLKLNE